MCGPEEDPEIKVWLLLMDGLWFTVGEDFLGVKAIAN